MRNAIEDSGWLHVLEVFMSMRMPMHLSLELLDDREYARTHSASLVLELTNFHIIV